jgi:hypothetical protein
MCRVICGSDFPAKTLLLVQIELIDLGAYIPGTKYVGSNQLEGPIKVCAGTNVFSLAAHAIIKLCVWAYAYAYAFCMWAQLCHGGL